MSSQDLTRRFLTGYSRVLQQLGDQIAIHNPAAADHAHCCAALILEHLLFLAFLQPTGWLDGDTRYLQHCFAATHDPTLPGEVAFCPQELCPTDGKDHGLFQSIVRGPFFRPGGKSGRPSELPVRTVNAIPDDLVIPGSAFLPFFDDLLDRYTFDIREAAAGHAGTTIDPSILGAIFEGLTLVDRPDGGLRKSTGSYFTPRAIVRATCRQVLQAYIQNRCDPGVSAVQPLRDLLLRTRIVDPAAGTGEFLVGMLHEMVALVRRLDLEAHGPDIFFNQPDYNFELKREILESGLYGVDLQPEALRLCRWRLWLSLLADYPYRPGRPAPRLPDLSQHICASDALAEPQLWCTQFPAVFEAKGGFDLCIGNPPYSARLPADRLRDLGKLYPTSAGQKNSAIMFMELASRLAPDGLVALVVPKSLTYSRGWGAIRRHISAHGRLIAVTDVSEAFDEVRLEQVVVVYRGQKAVTNASTYACYHLKNGDLAFRQASPLGLVDELDGLPVHVSPAFYEIYDQIKEEAIPLGTIAEIFRGLPWQARLLPAPTGESVPIRRGRQVQRYHLLPPTDAVVLSKAEAGLEKVRRLRQPKIVSQNIVAHVRRPRDRIIVMAALDEEPMLNLDTVENIVLRDAYREQFSLKYLLAILNSSLAAWFYYYLVYNRAVRTMHFDAYYAGKLPIKAVDPGRQAELGGLVDELMVESRQASEKRLKVRGKEIYRALDETLFAVYNLTDQQIQLILDTTWVE